MAKDPPKAERAFRAFLKEFAAEVADAEFIQVTFDGTGEVKTTSSNVKGLLKPAINPVCHPRIDLTAHFQWYEEPDPAPAEQGTEREE